MDLWGIGVVRSRAMSLTPEETHPVKHLLRGAHHAAPRPKVRRRNESRSRTILAWIGVRPTGVERLENCTSKRADYSGVELIKLLPTMVH